jgi:hypothetical protein
MVVRLLAFLKKNWVQQTLSILLSISIFTLILLNRSPNFLRPISLYSRTGFNLALGLIFLLLYVTFRLRGGIGRLLSLTLTLALFAFALAGLWAIGQTQSIVLNGIVPLFDASAYYADSLRLLAGQDFSDFSGRRPLFAGLFSVLLWMTGQNLMTALGILTLITAIACYLSAKEIQMTHGPEVAVFVLIILFLFYRHHSGTVMSENLGVPLGALGFALIWRGTAHQKDILVWLGLFVTTLALNARAGAFFTLPLLLLWGGWAFRETGRSFSLRYFVIGLVFVFAGVAVNLILLRLLAAPSGVPFSNFSYTLYGLASGGKSWHYVFEIHPELFDLREPEQSKTIYQMALALIRENPALLVQGALYNWSMLFSDSWYSAFSFVSGENRTVGLIVQWGILLLCALGFIKWFLNPDDSLAGLVGISAIGVLISVPFLPPTDAFRMRPYAASMIVFGLLPAMGLMLGMETLKLRFFHKPGLEDEGQSMTVAFTSLLVLGMVIGPLLVKSFGQPPQFDDATCGQGTDLMSLRFDPGTHFSILRQEEPGLDWMPDFHIGRFRRNAHSLPDPNLIQWAESIEPRTSIFYALDYHAWKNILVVVPTILLPQPGTLWQVCGEWEDGQNLRTYDIFYIRANAASP